MGNLNNLSHSAIGDLLDHCAYRVGLAKIVRLPRHTNGRLAVGTAYHAGIEAHENARKLYYTSRGRLGSPEGLSLTAMRTEAVTYALDVEDVTWEDDPLGYDAAQDMLLASLTHWYSSPIPEGQPGAGGTLRERVLPWRPVAIEYRFKLWLPPHSSLPVLGAADVAYRTPEGEIVLVDQKSANRFNKWRTDGVGLRDQPAMYVLASILSPGLPVERGVIPRFEYHITRTSTGTKDSFQGARCIPIQVDEVDLDYVKARVSQAHQQQLAGRWDKNPDTWLCRPEWCPFHKDAGGPCDPHGPPEYDIERYRDAA